MCLPIIKPEIAPNGSQMFNMNQIFYIELHILVMLEFCGNNLHFYTNKFHVFIEEILFWRVLRMELFETIHCFQLYLFWVLKYYSNSFS